MHVVWLANAIDMQEVGVPVSDAEERERNVYLGMFIVMILITLLITISIIALRRSIQKVIGACVCKLHVVITDTFSCQLYTKAILIYKEASRVAFKMPVV